MGRSSAEATNARLARRARSASACRCAAVSGFLWRLEARVEARLEALAPCLEAAWAVRGFAADPFFSDVFFRVLLCWVPEVFFIAGAPFEAGFRGALLLSCEGEEDELWALARGSEKQKQLIRNPQA